MELTQAEKEENQMRNEVLQWAERELAVEAIMNKVRRVKYKRHTTVFNTDAKIFMHHMQLPTEGILTYFEEHEYPRKGFPAKIPVEHIDIAKKILLGYITGFRDMFAQSKLKTVLFLWIFRKQNNASFTALVNIIYRICKPDLLESYRYCQAVREINRAFKMGTGKERLEKMQKFPILMPLKEIIATILEFDDSYRYRLQNVVQEFDRARFNKSPFSELIRICRIGEMRERSPRVIGTWRMMILILKNNMKYTTLKIT